MTIYPDIQRIDVSSHPLFHTLPARWPVQKIVRYLLLLLPSFLLLFLSIESHAGEQGLSLGYGFAALNKNSSTGKVEGGKEYDFLQLAYLHESPYWKKASFVVEPFAACINRPESGIDMGFDLLLRWYPSDRTRRGLYFDVGAGAAYTSISFKEQGTHLVGILVGGVGLRYRTFFIEDHFRHYSNGRTAYPNRSVNANIISVGMYF
jgi:hypothetical protein